MSNLLFFFISLIALVSVPCSYGLKPSSLVTQSTTLSYHKGPLLNGAKSINIYIIWYGSFSLSNRTTITDFFASFDPSRRPIREPTVSEWWKTTQSYKDIARKPISGDVKVAGQVGDAKYSLGKKIKRAHIAILVKKMIAYKIFPFDTNAIYLVLTSSDVTLERFCMGSCGFHDSFTISPKKRVVYAHVGDPFVQCPELCAWPFSVPAYGPPGPALVPPNGVGLDGMVMNIAAVLAGAATNPFRNGYFQGDALAPLEAVTSCAGIFGYGAYPGYPGKLMVHPVTKASYNVYGLEGRIFLLPAMWDLMSLACKVVA